MKRVAVFGFDEGTTQLLDRWGVPRCHPSEVSSASHLVLPSGWLCSDGSVASDAPPLAQQYEHQALMSGAAVVGWNLSASLLVGSESSRAPSKAGSVHGTIGSASAVAAGQKRRCDAASVASVAVDTHRAAEAAVLNVGMGDESTRLLANKALMRCRQDVHDPAAQAQQLRILAFLERAALYLLFCPGHAAHTSAISNQVLRWSIGVDMVPGKLEKLLWEKRGQRFDCSGDRFWSVGGWVRLIGTTSAAAVAEVESAAVAATATHKPSAAAWLGRRALFNKKTPDVAAADAVASLHAFGFEEHAGLPRSGEGMHLRMSLPYADLGSAGACQRGSIYEFGHTPIPPSGTPFKSYQA